MKYKKCGRSAAIPTVSKLNPNARNVISFYDENNDIPTMCVSKKYGHISFALDPSARNFVPSRGNLPSFSDVNKEINRIHNNNIFVTLNPNATSTKTSNNAHLFTSNSPQPT